MTPSPGQLRAARGWLGWSREMAAHRAGVHHSTLAKAERGAPSISEETLLAMTTAYAAAGVKCEGRDTVRRVVT